MKKSISHLTHFLVKKPSASFLKNPSKYLLVLLTLWIGMYSTPIHAQSRWTSQTSIDGTWSSVAFGSGVFVAVSTNGKVKTSPDGVTWTARITPIYNEWTAVTYGNGLFVAVSRTGSGNRVMTSPDGITWIIRASAADERWVAVTYGGGLFVAISRDFAGTPVTKINYLMTSPDGITWTKRISPANVFWSAITYGNGRFVAVSLDGNQLGLVNRVMTSQDGITWTRRSIPSTEYWTSVAYGNGLFVAVAADVMTSADGINWTRRPAAARILYTSITFGNGLFVAVANGYGNGLGTTGNRVMTSPDGIKWTSGISAADNEWSSVTYGEGTFVAVSEDGLKNQVMTFQVPYQVGISSNFQSAALISETSVRLAASTGDPGSLKVVEKGFVFTEKLLEPIPTLEKVSAINLKHPTAALGEFFLDASGLKVNKSYAVRAYIKSDNNRVTYSDTKFFTTNRPPVFNHPIIDGALNLTINENSTVVLDILASDPDEGQTFTVSVSGADGALFEVDQSTRKLSFKAAPDFESPRDLDKNNEYLLVLTVTDNGDYELSQTLEVRVKVSNVSEPPSLKGLVVDAGVTGARYNAEISSNGGGGAVSESGFVYSISSQNPNPELNGTGVTLLNSGVPLGQFAQVA